MSRPLSAALLLASTFGATRAADVDKAFTAAVTF